MFLSNCRSVVLGFHEGAMQMQWYDLLKFFERTKCNKHQLCINMFLTDVGFSGCDTRCPFPYTREVGMTMHQQISRALSTSLSIFDAPVLIVRQPMTQSKRMTKLELKRTWIVAVFFINSLGPFAICSSTICLMSASLTHWKD